MLRHFCFFLLLLLPGAACGPTMPPRYRQYILEKAPTDLECVREHIHIRKRAEKNVYTAYGCGARAAYRVDCNERSECEAVLVEVPVPIRPVQEETEK